ncbi:unannotated protein [freshwater metagenome]|uniref:Unannotated protein n=1 Tax=freshwater metagenome TaxID=449393 RepID=A0A6J7I2L1_9ZZZZ|nr:NAD(P)H-binding protein [Actinomycetota bacterium]
MGVADQPVLVVGASGPTGGEVVAALARRGARVRGLSRTEEGGALALAKGASEVGIADLRDGAALTKAMEGVGSAFYFCPRADPDEASLGRFFIDTAVAAGVQRVVIISMLHSHSPIPNHEASLQVEEKLARVPIEYVVLQPAMFMQTFPSNEQIRDWGWIGRPYPTDVLLSLVDLRDLAEVAARALLDDDMANGSFELCAPGMLSIADMAAILTDELGVPVEPREITIEEWAAVRGEGFESPHRRETYTAMFEYFAKYGFKGGNGLVLRHLLGRKPTSYRDFVARGGKTAPAPSQPPSTP